MRKRIEIPKGIYGITGYNFSHGKSNLNCVKEMIAGGIRIIQYRDKTKSMREKYQEAKEIAKLCKENNVLFLINDHVDLALLLNADGVHIGQDDYPIEEVRSLLGPNKIIGLSTHSPKQGLEAFQNENVDYIGVGPIFPTTTKDTKPAGLEYLDFVIRNLNLPFVAIGGIHEHNLQEILTRNVSRFCMVSGIVGAKNITEKVKKLYNQWEETQ
ncbi:thiamine phosphate synthase [Fusobacterium necrophorum]|uniref:thiamine phosphate synthase n=1 Tax=Fusobacterium necrophorum TaxID=859 RepID=UPI00370DE3DB